LKLDFSGQIASDEIASTPEQPSKRKKTTSDEIIATPEQPSKRKKITFP